MTEYVAGEDLEKGDRVGKQKAMFSDATLEAAADWLAEHKCEPDGRPGDGSDRDLNRRIALDKLRRAVREYEGVRRIALAVRAGPCSTATVYVYPDRVAGYLHDSLYPPRKPPSFEWTAPGHVQGPPAGQQTWRDRPPLI